MNHIPYKIALMRRDDLLRAAADRRLATQAARSAQREPSVPARRLRPLRQLHLTGRSRQTPGERTLGGRVS
jgi:hypothetical protein